ncbi:rhodanese-like domain-containing protein [Geobacter sp. DSM 9736]|uniref:rhodanese-like domain-containing protein n=1 Tax=Geobacter sp. DSM 9736 TaxID=1277350 RepID=UPI000B50B143|nr:rhodanese-like domain-containing protein [Geobacter sp. DSM 9736]SNB44805.1 3-mercaptopyruvate sulfurtransferase SseA, contains two rhodanese domains [Geobacter sp. DSM 9736]
MNCKSMTAVLAAMIAFAGHAAADQAAPPAKPGNAKICTNCHKPDTNNLRGHWESVAMKSSSIQLKIDDRSEILRFDKGKVQVLNAPEKGDTEKMLRSIKKGHEVRIEFTEKDGVKYASVVASKPPIKLSPEEKIALPEVEKLVALGPQKGNYLLFDSRPAPRFKEGSIPTAVSLPFPEFDKNIDKLPQDKSTPIIFYCSGITCNMSPGSQKKAKALGYTNIKVFVEGMPAWLSKNYGVVTAPAMKDAYKDIPYVLLDARPSAAAEKGFIKGAVTFPAADDKALKLLPKKEMKAPVIVYDEDGKGNAAAVAKGIVKAGYTNVFVLTEGLAGWKKAQLPVETGKLAAKVTYVPKPKPGEFPMEDFKKLITSIPAGTVLVDVRNPDELGDGIIKGAVNIPADRIDQHLSEFKDKRVIAYCNTGTRAEMAYHALKAKGFTNAFFLNAKVDFDEGKPEISK